MKLHGAAVFVCMLALPPWTAAETVPMQGAIDSRIRVAAYDPNEVYRLYGVVGYHIDLEFESGESFVDLSGGDLEALTFEGHANILTLKPKAVTVEMNLSVSTTKRRYYFEYTASAKRADRFIEPVMYVVRFTYGPQDGQEGPAAAERVEHALNDAVTVRPRNREYAYCGHHSLKPIFAYDDGVQTHLGFSARGELPAVFLRNADGSESLLNFHVDGPEMVLHRVAQRFIVRRGKLTGCIVNQGFSGGSERLQSGTVTPFVERQRKEGDR